MVPSVWSPPEAGKKVWDLAGDPEHPWANPSVLPEPPEVPVCVSSALAVVTSISSPGDHGKGMEPQNLHGVSMQDGVC